jgi:hypothetical protein
VAVADDVAVTEAAATTTTTSSSTTNATNVAAVVTVLEVELPRELQVNAARLSPTQSTQRPPAATGERQCKGSALDSAQVACCSENNNERRRTKMNESLEALCSIPFFILNSSLGSACVRSSCEVVCVVRQGVASNHQHNQHIIPIGRRNQSHQIPSATPAITTAAAPPARPARPSIHARCWFHPLKHDQHTRAPAATTAAVGGWVGGAA